VKRAPRSGGKLVDLRQAELITGLPRTRLRDLVERGVLSRVDPEITGRAIYLVRADLDRFIAQHTEVR
jgi:hypothetical protein